MALTALAISKLKPKEKLYFVADGGGLCLAISPTGGKSWHWRYRYNNKAQIIGLGKYPEVSLEQARRKRDDTRATLNSGVNPIRHRKAEKLRKVAECENTFERVCRGWLAVKNKSLNTKYAAQSLRRVELHVLPELGDLPISEITTPDVVRVVEKVAERGTIETAHWVKQVISQTFRYAVQRGLCPFNPAADMRNLLPAVEEKHFPCIHPKEFPQLLRDMQGYNGDLLTKSAMELLALTFVRTSELIGARWEEIDFDREEWNIPKERMKMRRPHMVPLSRQSLAILKALHEETGHRDLIFFSARCKSKHISNGAVLSALRRMKYHGRMSGHGFRALASTILNEKGYSPDVIERQLSHDEKDKVRSAYNRAEYLLERKKMMQDYADLIDGIRNSEGAELVRFKQSAKALLAIK